MGVHIMHQATEIGIWLDIIIFLAYVLTFYTGHVSTLTS